MRDNPNIGWPMTDQDAKIGIQPATEQAIRDLNARAGALTEAIDDFERVARARIRVADGPHATEAKAGVEHAAAVQSERETAQEALNALAVDENRGGVPVIVTRPRLILTMAPYAASEGKRLDPKDVAQVQLRFPPNVGGAMALPSGRSRT